MKNFTEWFECFGMKSKILSVIPATVIFAGLLAVTSVPANHFGLYI